MLILQLELSDLLFTESVKESKCELMNLEHSVVAKRNGLDHFLTEAAKHFRIAVWSIYPSELTEQLANYISSLGINMEYVMSQEDCVQFGSEIKKFEKRLKRLNPIGFDPKEIISLEFNLPEKENYRNNFIVERFSGQWDNALTNQLPELISLSKVQNTNLIN
jgi:TFIIF-interacting CTD phosphatase-like protein